MSILYVFDASAVPKNQHVEIIDKDGYHFRISCDYENGGIIITKISKDYPNDALRVTSHRANEIKLS